MDTFFVKLNELQWYNEKYNKKFLSNNKNLIIATPLPSLTCHFLEKFQDLSPTSVLSSLQNSGTLFKTPVSTAFFIFLKTSLKNSTPALSLSFPHIPASNFLFPYFLKARIKLKRFSLSWNKNTQLLKLYLEDSALVFPVQKRKLLNGEKIIPQIGVAKPY